MSPVSTIETRLAVAVGQNATVACAVKTAQASLNEQIFNPDGLLKGVSRDNRIDPGVYATLCQVVAASGISSDRVKSVTDALVMGMGGEVSPEFILNTLREERLVLQVQDVVEPFLQEEFGMKRFDLKKSASGFGWELTQMKPLYQSCGRMNEVSRSVHKWPDGTGRNVIYAESSLWNDPGMKVFERPMLHRVILRTTNSENMNVWNQEIHVGKLLKPEGMTMANRALLTSVAGADLLRHGFKNVGTSKHKGEMKHYVTRGIIEKCQDNTRFGSLGVVDPGGVCGWDVSDRFAGANWFAGAAGSLPKP